MEQKIVRQPLIILLSATILLCLLSLQKTKKYLPPFLSNINALEDLQTNSKDTSNEKLIAQKNKASKLKIITKENLITSNSFQGFTHKLKQFKTNKQKMRIAYLGDSFIEADFITDDLRQMLQSKYGGNGIGFIPIQTVSSGMQRSIKQQTSNNWNTYNLHQNSINASLGLSGYAFTPNENSSVQYTTNKPYGSFNTVKLLYGPTTEPLKLEVNEDSITQQVVLPISNESINAITVNETLTNSIKLNFPKTNTLFYGLSFEDSNGMYVDNFSFRGTNGTQLLKLDTANIKAFAAIQNYDLVILHYGINVIGNNNTNLDWYKIGLQKTINWVKKYLPNSSILLISTSDKSTKTNGEYTTDKGIPVLLNIQESLAAKNNLTFWNLYNVMGGNNSMAQWANQSPPMANKDYTHITYKGAKFIATKLFEKLTK